MPSPLLPADAGKKPRPWSPLTVRDAVDCGALPGLDEPEPP